jgi:hypothetical protein
MEVSAKLMWKIYNYCKISKLFGNFPLYIPWFKSRIAEFAIPLRSYTLPHIPANRVPVNFRFCQSFVS